MTVPASDFFRLAEQRIGRLTLVLGLSAAAATALGYSAPAGLGVAMGTVLSWISFLWLQQALDGLTRLAVGQHERVERAQPVRFPLGAALKLAGRYILVAVAAYATITYLQVPVFSVLAGLFALGAAAMSEGIYEAVARKP